MVPDCPAEDLNAFLAGGLGRWSQTREWVVRLAGVAKHHAQQFAVILKNIQLRLKYELQALLQFKLASSQRFRDPAGVLCLNNFVVGLNNRFLAWEVVVSGA